MAKYDSADLLARCRFYAHRPTSDDQMPDPYWYNVLTEAQDDAFDDIASRAPDAFYSAPVKLTTADGGKTYTFGTDADGAQRWPVGHLELYAALNHIPYSPLMPGADYLVEGTLIRVPSNWKTTFTDGPYARFVLKPDTIAASSEPTFPKPWRMMLVYRAVEKWASRPESGADPRYWSSQYDAEFTRALIAIRTAYNMAATQANFVAVPAPAWWRYV